MDFEFLVPGCTKDMENNHQLHFSFKTPHPIITQILSKHPIRPALTKTTTDVPEELLFHLWRSIEYINPRGKNIIPYFQYTLPTFIKTKPAIIILNLEHFRSILGFPEPNSKQGATDFDETPNTTFMLKKIKNLGYDGELNGLNDFKKKNLHRLWFTLCSIISYCLTPTKKGQDTITSHTLTYLYSLSHDVHLDLAEAAWNHMALNVKRKMKNPSSMKYIPFIRFFTILIQHALNSNQNILRFPDSPKCHIPIFGSVYKNSGVTTMAPMPIPDSLLRLVPHEDPDFMNYRVYIARAMGAASRQRPATALHRSPSEGSRSKKRKEGEGVEKAPNTKTYEPSAPPEPSKPPKKKLKTTHKTLSVNQPTPDSSIQASQSLPTTSLDTPSKGRLKSMLKRKGKLKKTKQPSAPLEPIPEHHDDLMETPEIQGGFEGGVENEREIERSGLGKGQKENVGPPIVETTQTRRDETPRVEVESFPLSRAQASVRHSGSSQKESVSALHGQKPNPLSQPPLEVRDIESEETSAHLPTFVSIPLESSSHLRTHDSDAHPLDNAGTDLEMLNIVPSRGLSGNPVTANIKQAVQTGSTTVVEVSLHKSTRSPIGEIPSGRTVIPSEPTVAPTTSMSVFPQIPEHQNSQSTEPSSPNSPTEELRQRKGKALTIPNTPQTNSTQSSSQSKSSWCDSCP